MTADRTKSRDLWFRVDSNLVSLRRHLQLADNEENYQAVGVLARETIISLSQAVLDDELASQLPETSNTDAAAILGKYFDRVLPGTSNRDLRSYSKSCLKLAVSLQHKRNASYPEAELCTESCAHLVVLVRILFFEQISPPNERFRHPRSASAESQFVTSWLTHHFDNHPVAVDHGFKFAGIIFNGPEITLMTQRNGKEHLATVYHPYWWRGANRTSAESLIDELLVLLLTELDKEEFRVAGLPPA